MRDIKFRGWVQKENCMIQHREVVERAHLQFNDSFNSKDIVMQYTGLKDENGVEIYEGDVVEIIHPCWSNKCLVEFKNGSFIFKSLEQDNKDYIVPGYTFMREKWTVEILGNIYNNPELLTIKK